MSNKAWSKMNHLADGVSVEQMIAQYFDSDALIEPAYKVYRMNNKGQRWYYRLHENGTPEFFMSVTSLCYATLPTPKQLTDWIATLGVDAAKKYSEIKAHYGTLMHKICGELVICKTFDLDRMEDAVEIYRAKEGLEFYDVKYWADELRKDVLAFAQLLIDVDFKPLAIEVVLVHPEGYGGAIDLVGEMNLEVKGFFGDVYASGENKGQPKESKRTERIRAIIDLKSGKKGFYETHEVQLRAYKEMWNHEFFAKPVTHVFNWAPSEWRETPSYKLKDQTNSASSNKWPHLVQIARVERERRERTALQITGKIDFASGIDKNYKTVTFDELVKNQMGESCPAES